MIVLDQHELVQLTPTNGIYRSAHGKHINVCYLDGHVRRKALIDPDPN